MVGVAIMVELNGNNACRDARIALFGVGEKPERMKRAEQWVRGKALREIQFAAVAQAVGDGADSVPADGSGVIDPVLGPLLRGPVRHRGLGFTAPEATQNPTGVDVVERSAARIEDDVLGVGGGELIDLEVGIEMTAPFDGVVSARQVSASSSEPPRRRRCSPLSFSSIRFG